MPSLDTRTHARTRTHAHWWVPVACGRGAAAMTLGLFTVSPPVWELITVRTRRLGWKDEQIAVCLQHVCVCRPHQCLFRGCGA